MAFVIPWKKVLVPRHSEFYGRVKSEAWNGKNGMKRISMVKNPAPANRIDSMFFVRDMLRTGIPRACSYFFSTERNSEYFSPLRNGLEQNSGSFLFRGMVQNGIPRVCFYFCSMVQDFKYFSPLRNRSERNFENFLFRGTAGIPPEQTNCSVYSIFRGIIFCRKLPTLVTLKYFKGCGKGRFFSSKPCASLFQEDLQIDITFSEIHVLPDSATRFFCFRFFHESFSPGPLIITLGSFQNF
jgi:hypothetical protein